VSDKQVLPTQPQARDEATPEQIEARRQLLAMMLRHNPPATPEELAEIERDWDQG
jgi:hypothetical protein